MFNNVFANFVTFWRHRSSYQADIRMRAHPLLGLGIFMQIYSSSSGV